jgi:uncharacterized protein YcnI
MNRNLLSILIFLSANILAAQVQAHVTIDPKTAPAGSYAKLVFRVPHGCDGSPTTEITVSIPKGVLAVKPQVHVGWKITTKTTKYEKPISLHGQEVAEGVSEVTWKGGPLDDAYMDEFGMSVKLPDQAGEKLVFPVIQVCKKGKSEWVEAHASTHADSGAHLPAPVLTLEKSSMNEDHMHMHMHSGAAAPAHK